MSEETQPQYPNGEPPKRLTDWAKEPDLRTLKKDVEQARPIQQQQVAKITRWLHNMNITGPAKLKPRKGRSSVQPKLIRKQAEWRYPSLSEPFLSNSRLFQISPVTWEDSAAAEQNELVLNWQFRTKLNAVTFVDQLVRTFVDEGTVVVRVGWERQTRKEKVMAPVYQYTPMVDAQQIQALTQAMQMEHENPNDFQNLPPEIIESVRYSEEQGEPFLAQQVGEQEIEQDKVLVNRPTIEVVNTANFVIDATCGSDQNRAMFMGYSEEVTRSSLTGDDRYKNLDYVNWDTSILAQPDYVPKGPPEINFEDKSRQKVVLNHWYGLYDTEGNGSLNAVHVAWIGDVMVLCELNPFPDELPPFVIIPYLPVRNSVYGEPDGELLEDNQRIIGAVTRGIIDSMARSANGQRGMAKNMLDPVNKRRFEAGEDYEFNPSTHPANGLIEHKYPEIPASALQMLQLINGEAESLTGVKMFSDSGLSGAALGPTATGAKGVLSAAALRESAILRRLAQGMVLIARKIVAMNQVFLSEEEVIRVTNDQFVKVRREDLKGDFDLKVDVSTPEEDNARAQELAFMLQTMGPNSDQGMRNLVMAEIARLRRMPELEHSIKHYQPQPDPMQQQIQQLQIQKLQEEIALLRAQVNEKMAQAQLHTAKAGEAGAKTDQANLDYVEQQSGIKHSRRMDELSQQAEANQNLAITKGILDQRPPGAHSPDSPTPDAPTRDNLLEAFGFNELTKRRQPQPLQ